MPPKKMYCGNKPTPPLGREFGDRWSCFKRGVGVGMSLPATISIGKLTNRLSLDFLRTLAGKYGLNVRQNKHDTITAIKAYMNTRNLTKLELPK